MTDHEKAVRTVECPACRAMAGECCRTNIQCLPRAVAHKAREVAYMRRQAKGDFVTRWTAAIRSL
jgi:hypothetical protein